MFSQGAPTLLLFKIKTLCFFKSRFKFTKWGKDTEISRISPVPTHTSSLSKSSSRVVFLLQLVSLHWHVIITQGPQFRLCVVHSWCCTCYEVGQVYDGMYASLLYHTKYFHCLPNPLCSIYSSLPQSLNSWKPVIFLLSSQFCLFQKVTQLKSHSMWLVSISNMYVSVLHVFSWLDSLFIF